MVFKKYSYKDGKKYGPYLYKNERVGEKVVTSYVGRGEEQKKSAFSGSLLIFLGIIGAIILVSAFFIFFKGSPTGFVTIDVQPQYNLGESLNGIINFNFKEGELIPRDSKILVSLGGQEKEFALSDLIEDHLISGTYYAEQHPLTGSGEGYGALGEKTVYPTISFDLLVSNSGTTEITPDTTTPENTPTDTSTTETTTETQTPTTETTPDASAIDSSTTETTDSSGSSSDSSSSSSSSDSSSSSSDSSSSSSDSSSSDSSSSDSSSSDSGSSESSGDSGGITGNVIGENEFTVSGSVNKEQDFEYNLDAGQTAELVSGSVMMNGSSASENLISVKKSSGKIIVSTDYSTKEKGFGRDYLGDFVLLLPIDLQKLGITAENGTLSVKIVSQELEVAHAEKEIGIRPESIPINNTLTFIKDIPQQRIKVNSNLQLNLKEYFNGAESYEVIVSNIVADIDSSDQILTLTPEAGLKGARKAKIIAISGENKVESNEFNILVSSGAINIDTTHTPIKIGEEVKWTQNITLDSPENITVEVPITAENIVVQKVDEASGVTSDVNSDNIDTSSFGMTGNVVIDIELHREPRIVTIFKNFFSHMTGNVIEGEVIANTETTVETKEVAISDDATSYTIEYTTPAPTVQETQISEDEKQVVVSAEESLGYTDVLAFTDIPELYSVGEESKIKVYWRDEDKYLAVDAYDLDGNGKLDYIEWNVPHLSTQTFRIIQITKAELLDSNRNFVQEVYEFVRTINNNTIKIPTGNYLRVYFEKNLTLGKDMTVYAKGLGSIVVYNRGDNQAIGELIINNTQEIVKYTIYPNYTDSDVYDLQFSADIDVDYVVDPIDCTTITDSATCGGTYGCSSGSDPTGDACGSYYYDGDPSGCAAREGCTAGYDTLDCSMYINQETCESGNQPSGCSPVYDQGGSDCWASFSTDEYGCFGTSGCSASYGGDACDGYDNTDESTCLGGSWQCAWNSENGDCYDGCNLYNSNSAGCSGALCRYNTADGICRDNAVSYNGCSGLYNTYQSYNHCDGTYSGSFNSCSGSAFTCSGTVYSSGEGPCSGGTCASGSSCISYSDSTICTDGQRGSPCGYDSDCTSGNDVCIGGSNGVCSASLAGLGESCMSDVDCFSGQCGDMTSCTDGTNGYQCYQGGCASGNYCDMGTCYSQAGLGESCMGDGECSSGQCGDFGQCTDGTVGNYCFSDNTCAEGNWCYESSCFAKVDVGVNCNDGRDAQCISGFCLNDFDAGYGGSGSICSDKSIGSPCSTLNQATECSSGQCGDGGACTDGESGNQCYDSGTCAGGLSCTDSVCTITPALIAEYNFENNANDALGVNNGTWSGAGNVDQYVAGVSGQAASFDGDHDSSDEYISVSYSSSLNYFVGDGFTVSAWIQSQDYDCQTVGLQTILANWPADNHMQLGLYNNAAGQCVLNTYVNGLTSLSDSSDFSAYSDGDWVLVTVTYSWTGSGYNITAYANDQAIGSIVAESSRLSSIGSSDFIIGGNADYGSQREFYGSIDELRIYNYALTAENISTYYTSTAPVTPALIAEYKFQNNADDALGMNNGTWGGTGSLNQYAAGVLGQAASFDGSAYVSTNYQPTTGADPFTLSAWVKTSTTSYADAVVFGSNGNTGEVRGIGMYSDGNFEIENQRDDLISSVPINDGTWHLITYTWNGTNEKGYVDGNLAIDANSAYTPNIGTGTLGIGYGPEIGDYFWSGLIDEVKIYSGALNDSAIVAQYESERPKNLTEGLVAYYPLDGDSIDYAGGNNATNSGATFTTGKVGQTAVFDGNGYITQDNNLGISGNSPRTISFWAYPSSGYIPFGFGGQATGDAVYLYSPYNGKICRGVWGGMGGCSTNDYATNAWQLITVTFDGTSFKLYLNGSLEFTDTATYSTTDTPIAIGELYNYASQQFVGNIDEFAVWNRSLDINEVVNLYNGGAGRAIISLPLANGETCALNSECISGYCADNLTCANPPLNFSLVAYYPLNGNAKDYSGNGNNGTWTGTASYIPGALAGKQGAVLTGASGNHISASDAGFPSGNSAFSESFWIKSSDVSSQLGFSAYGTMCDTDLAIGLYSGKPRIYKDCVGGPHVSDTSVADDSWHHVVFTYDGSSLSAYVDGVDKTSSLDTSSGNPIPFNITLSGNFYIGSDPNGDNIIVNLEELAIWNRSLSADDVAAIWNGGSGMALVDTTSLIPGDISDCENINQSGNYSLRGNIGSGGDCLIINANDVVINGNGYTITGNVNGSSLVPDVAGYSFNLSNINVDGVISSMGDFRGAGGVITITNSNTSTIIADGGFDYTGENSAGNGGVVNVLYSNTGAISSKGGDGAGGWGAGGNGGIINITSSTYGILNVSSGVGAGSSGLVGHIYLDGEIFNPIYGCSVLTEEAGTYTLMGDIGSSGECLIINANDVVIDGKGFTITGNVNGSGLYTAYRSYNFNLTNVTVTGSVTSDGEEGSASNGGNGGIINIIDSTTSSISANGGIPNGGIGGNGGTIIIINSNVSTITANGGNGFDGDNLPGNGGTIWIWTPATYGTLSVAGGTGPYGDGLIGHIYVDSIEQCSQTSDCSFGICSANGVCVIDTTYPQISFTAETPSNGVALATDSIHAAVDVIEDNFASLTITLYNGNDLVDSPVSTDGSSLAYDFTSLSDGTYSLTATVCDLADQCNSTETRTIILDNEVPIVSFILPTENNNSYATATGIVRANVSVTGNLAEITFDLIDAEGSHNPTTYTGEQANSVRGYSFQTPAAGTYTYQVSVTSRSGLTAATEIRTIIVEPSCLAQCDEGASSDCTINSECYLSSYACTNGVCDFRNLVVDSTIRTLYDADSGNGLPLVLNLSGNITFIGGNNHIIFNGRPGSDIGEGSIGGNASVVNITVPGLFNTTFAMFEGMGGKSTLSGANGGNGGSLILNYRGLIGRPFSDNATTYYDAELDDYVSYPTNYPTLIGGSNALDAVTGNAGLLTFNKNIECSPRRDVDIDNDGRIDDADYGLIQEDYNDKKATDVNFVDTYDINCDGTLNVREIGRIGFEIGTR